MTTSAGTWEPSPRERERRALRRERSRRDVLVATVAAVVLLGGLLAALLLSPGWPTVRSSFLSWPDAKAAFPSVIKGFLKYNVVGFLIAEPVILLIGASVAVVRSSTSAAMFSVRVLAVVYTDVFRGLPTFLVVIVFGLAIPGLRLQGVTTNTFWLGLAALCLCYGAYVAEVFRAGIESIHPSQVASADTLGLTRWQAMWYVVLPQATRRVTPPLLNDFISLQKDTALLSAIFVFDGLFAAQDYAAYHFNYTPITVVGVLYLLLTIPLTRFTDVMLRRALRRQFAGAR
ncbi:MAG TPA: amino acid ABC transporter permease [Nocardioides sp.]|uniref:amino acid ABC transporter permease n=1 Tax=Nocardioides sp. TaxID=35761 RepID=UPI002F41376F